MGLNAVKMLQISITTNSRAEILEYIRKYLSKKPKTGVLNAKKKIKPLVIVTPNPEQIVYAGKDRRFADILNRADIAIPDGIGVVWVSKFLNKKTEKNIKERIPGVELVGELTKIASAQGVPIGLIGGRGKVAVEAFECLRRKYPGLIGWTEEGPELLVSEGHPGFEQFARVTAERIKRSNAGIVFVGLGAPKQEFFIERLAKELSILRYHQPIILMAVGGSFDIIAGRVQRAPLLMRLIGFEWAWRLIREPWRWKRQLALAKFIWLVFREKRVTR